MLIIPDCFQVSIQAVCGGHVIENVIGVRNNVGSSAGAAGAVKVAWENTNGPLDNLPAEYAMTNYHAVDISSSSGAIVDDASTTAGGIVAVSLATRAACALVQWNGSTRNRSSRGRMYFGPLYEGALDADGATINSTVRTNLGTAITQFLTDLNSQNYPLVVLSRVLSEAFPVTTSAVEGTCATQRRRLR